MGVAQELIHERMRCAEMTSGKCDCKQEHGDEKSMEIRHYWAWVFEACEKNALHWAATLMTGGLVRLPEEGPTQMRRPHVWTQKIR